MIFARSDSVSFGCYTRVIMVQWNVNVQKIIA